MKKLAILLLFIFLIGCKEFQTINKDKVTVRFVSFKVTSIDLYVVDAEVLIKVTNKYENNIFVDRFDLNLYSQDIKIGKIQKEGSVVFNNTTKSFLFKLKIPYKQAESIVWRNGFSDLKLVGNVYFNFPFGNPSIPLILNLER